MAYEISEGAAAAAIFLEDAEYGACEGKKYEGVEGEAAIIKVMGKLYDNLKNVEMSSSKTQYEKWFNPANLNTTIANKGKDSKLTAVIHGCSAAQGIKAWFKSMKHNYQPKRKHDQSSKVFVTGAEWHGDINFLKMSVGGWDDYNSSDLVIILGQCYYGISLKKKPRKNSANPPMINKSLEKMLTEVDQKEIGDKFTAAKAGFYGNIIATQMKTGGALAGSTFTGFKNEDFILTQIYNPIKKQWTNLIDLKGEGKLKLGSMPSPKRGKYQYQWTAQNKGAFIDGVKEDNVVDFAKNLAVRKLFAYVTDPEIKSPDNLVQTKWTMRKAVNNAVGASGTSGLFSIVNEMVEKEGIATLVGGKLVNAVLKTELKKEFTKLRKQHADKHFGFALVTALGEFKTGTGKNAVGKITSPGSPASVKSDTTIQQTVADLIVAGKNKNWKMQIDEVTTLAKQEAATKDNVGLPAKLFFQIGLQGPTGFINALDLELRYKGAFSPSPQFIGGISDDFIDILNQKNQALSYKFGAACNKP